MLKVPRIVLSIQVPLTLSSSQENEYRSNVYCFQTWLITLSAQHSVFSSLISTVDPAEKLKSRGCGVTRREGAWVPERTPPQTTLLCYRSLVTVVNC